MNTAYSFGVVRYHHDVVTGEFANLGVVVFAPDAPFLRALFTNSYKRITDFFDDADGRDVRALGKALERLVNQAGSNAPSLLDKTESRNLQTVVSRFLPPDDSALQFEAVGAGISNDLEATLEDLFERHVARYAHKRATQSRSDEEVLSVYRKVLEERHLFESLHPKTIETPVYRHEFPVAWKNGVWNTCEAVSFDLVKPGSIVEKANNWVGRLHSLSASGEEFRVHLLLGSPSHGELSEPYRNAKNILESAPLGPRLYEEGGAGSFADLVAEDLADKGAGDH